MVTVSWHPETWTDMVEQIDPIADSVPSLPSFGQKIGFWDVSCEVLRANTGTTVIPRFCS